MGHLRKCPTGCCGGSGGDQGGSLMVPAQCLVPDKVEHGLDEICRRDIRTRFQFADHAGLQVLHLVALLFTDRQLGYRLDAIVLRILQIEILGEGVVHALLDVLLLGLNALGTLFGNE